MVHKGVFGLESAEEASEEVFFGPMESKASKFGYSVKTYKVSATINCKHIIQRDYCNLRVITQSAVDTPDNVLQYSNL